MILLDRSEAPPREQRQARPLAAFDFFAGVGGFRIAAEAAGMTVVGHSEIDANCLRTYDAAHETSNDVDVGDLTGITRDSRLVDWPGPLPPSKERDSQIRRSLPGFDVLLAGFPCQPHSLMGNRKGMTDDRGQLFFDIAAVLRVTRPQVVVLENVRAIRSVNGGDLFRAIVSTLDDLGYNTRVWELNAADYGVPQVRRRLFVVASADPLPDGPPAVINPRARRFRTAWHALERSVQDKYYLSERILHTVLKDQHKGYRRPATINRLLARPLTRTMHKMHRASQDNYYSDPFILGEWNETSEEVVLNPSAPSRIRRITPREAFRLQSFPDEFTEKAIASGVSDTQLYMQAGNAVPPRLAQAVLEHVT